jgi:argininosuccinate synthase
LNEKVVLAFSGGLGTIAALHLLKRRFGKQIITFTANLGQKGSTQDLCEQALQLGASSAHIADLRARFMRHYAWPSIRAGALYESGYALAHALARPLIVAELVKIAREEGAQFIAHGCAAKSNDQVRFEVSAAALAPELRLIAPLRDHELLRLDEVQEYCDRNRLLSRVDKVNRFSITENLYGSSMQWVRAPDSFSEVPDEVWHRTTSPDQAPDQDEEMLISFEEGVPVALDEERLDPVPLVERLAERAGAHGVGRLVTIEDRLIGIKMVEVYEQPAGTVIHDALRALQRLALPHGQLQFMPILSRKYAELCYQGYWFSELRESLDAFFTKATEYVTGDVRVGFYKGRCWVKGARSAHSLYSQGLAEPTTEGDVFEHDAVRGYMETLSQPLRVPRGGWKPRL